MKKNGFTLIELLVVVTIIGILSSISIFGLNSMRQRAVDTGYLSGIRDLQLALEGYKSVNNKYPNSFTELVPGFISKVPTSEYTYRFWSEDNKTYCVLVRGRVNKPESQPELNSTICPKTWITCKGPNLTDLKNLTEC